MVKERKIKTVKSKVVEIALGSTNRALLIRGLASQPCPNPLTKRAPCRATTVPGAVFRVRDINSIPPSIAAIANTPGSPRYPRLLR